MINDRIIEQILDRADIVEIISEFTELKKKGSHYECCCPFHNEKTPSFIVDPRKNTYFCYGACQEGGNAIRFIQKIKNISFPEAVEELAKRYGIEIDNNKEQPSEAEKIKNAKREAMFAINERVCEFYVSQLKSAGSDSATAHSYIIKRWGDKFASEMRIGFATSDWDRLRTFAEKTGLSIELMLEMGLLKKSEKNGKIYDFYRNRITIPIRDRFRRIIGFTARDISGDKETPKYLNSIVSEIYNKENSIFGIDLALRQGAKEEKFYLVEGAPDVMKLQSIGITNTIASLGASWSDKQFATIKKFATKICFLPDADKPKNGENFGTGIKAVCKSGIQAMQCGFAVSVKQIPLTPDGEKNDPDSFINSKNALESLEEQDFILWYARIIFGQKHTTEELSECVNKIAKLIAGVGDDVKENMYQQELQSIYKGKNLWTIAINAAKKGDKENNTKKSNKTLDRDLYATYGFYEENNCYFSISKEGNEFQWSNFTMKPLFLIKDSILPKRLYKIKNINNHEEIIELKQEDLVSLQRFKVRVEGLGNYIWLAKEDQLTKLKMYLYEETREAIEITQLGWNKKGFYCFGNGIYDTDWHTVDEFGIVDLGDKGNFYLPANSKIYRDESKLFQFERKFVHNNFNGISFRDYTDKLIQVFGDNAKIGVCFFIASLFRDIITSYTKSFPILNLFGPKGSGKSELGHSLMSFFIIENTPPNIQNSTIAAMADLVAQCANALVHIDEFKNNIDIDKREFLKGLWDGAGRSRMNMDRDKKREITNVDCGVILSGQEMATADIALFSRLIFLTFNRSEFSQREKTNYNELTEIRKRGCTHLTLQILRHRAKFEAEFYQNLQICLSELQGKTESENIEDRILRNWVIPLAAFRTLNAVIDVSFDYKEIFKICVDGIIQQNGECKTNNELANFWNVVSFLQQDGEIWNEADYRIDYLNVLKTDKINSVFKETRPILMLRRNRIFQLYKKFGRQVGDTILPEGSLIYYLENSKEYLGKKKSVRFKNIQKGYRVTETIIENNKSVVRQCSTPDQAICFDYSQIMERYSINLEIEHTNDISADEENTEQEPNTEQKLPF